jgi:HSP20 family protein
MTELVRFGRGPWSIFDELAGLQDEFRREFADVGQATSGLRGRFPAMNVWSADRGVIVDVELPGVEPGDVDISVTGNELVLSGKTASADSGELRRCERPRGAFTRELQLPFRADASKVTAHFRNGILRIDVPRSEEDKPRKIAIEAA